VIKLKHGCYVRMLCIAAIMPAPDNQLDITLTCGAGYILDSEASAQLIAFMEGEPA